MSDKVELLPCPFCGIAATLESNHDWHRIIVDHDEACIFLEPEVSMVPATDDQLSVVVADWNRRAALSQQPAPAVASDGWKLVPIKPSIEMVEAGYEASLGQPDRSGHARTIEVYDAMLAAAPAAPAPAAQEPEYPPCDYCGATVECMPWHGSGLLNGAESRHIHACNSCRHMLPAAKQPDTVPMLRELLKRIERHYQDGLSINPELEELRALLDKESV